ncbi:MAG: IcmT/TraK family protein [Gammaproteobacteria bacterium]|nr:IcmT/TraK family protein [Gammaproteobacteria bacterium]
MSGEPIQWRDSMRSPKLYFIDVRLLLLLLLWAFWPRVVTFVPVVVAIVFLMVAGYRGYRPGAALRAVRRRLAGPPRALSPRRYRRIVDFGALAGIVFAAASGAPQSARAEFLYVPPEVKAEALPTLALAEPAEEGEDLVRVLLDRDTTVAMGVPAGAAGTQEEGGGGKDLVAALSSAQPEAEPPPEQALPEAVPEPWEVHAGSTLGQVLSGWGERAGVEVVMLSDREYLIGSSHVYHGAFVDAVRTLLFGLGHLSYAPVGQLFSDGKVLAVYHRVPAQQMEGMQ